MIGFVTGSIRTKKSGIWVDYSKTYSHIPGTLKYRRIIP